jgi:hypothetical protein
MAKVTLTSQLSKTQQSEIRIILKSLGKKTALNNLKWDEDNKAMGSGGVGQIQLKKRLKEIRVQTTYGKGRNNYADVIIINIPEK